MEKKFESKYQISEDTSRMFDAIRQLDEAFGMVADSIESAFGEGSFYDRVGSDFMEKHKALRDETYKLVVMMINDNLGTVGKYEI